MSRQPFSIAQLAARSRPTGYEASKSLKDILRIATIERNAGDNARTSGDVEAAFIHYTKASIIMLEELPGHPKFGGLTEAQKDAVQVQGQIIAYTLGEVKSMVFDRFIESRTRHSINDADHGLPPPLHAPVPVAQRQQQCTPSTSRLRIEDQKEKESQEPKACYQSEAQRLAAEWRQRQHDRANNIVNGARQEKERFENQECIQLATLGSSSSVLHPRRSVYEVPATTDSHPNNNPNHNRINNIATDPQPVRKHKEATALGYPASTASDNDRTNYVPKQPANTPSKHGQGSQDGSNQDISIRRNELLPSAHQSHQPRVRFGSDSSDNNMLGGKAITSNPKPPASADIAISRKLTVHEVISRLVVHECRDLTNAVDYATFSEHPVSHGGFSDIYCGYLLDQTQVAIKVLRISMSSITGDPKHFKASLVHGDLKGANVLISDEGVPVLADFGNSLHPNQSMKFTETTSNNSLTVRWSAAEIITESGMHSKSSDVYALAMTIYEIFAGVIPYNGRREPTIIYLVVTKREPPVRPEGIPTGRKAGDKLWGLLLRCWSFEPSARPGASKVAKFMKTVTPNDLSPIYT
ncbi:unnamed protein product [Rhizoctonia solani]|uniref:Protein kinase domain-containing protein n=1 Tax=Rhizoctonia solani TaxID=456999 RepID=A0A8H2XTF8_9AGAM|nr:unnamed protein product [Rhizoctonia solani]